MKHGHDLGVDLASLKAAADLDLPLLAEDYINLNGKIANTHDADEFAFGGGPLPTRNIQESWSSLRNALQNLLGQGGVDFENVGFTLDYVINLYKENDGAAARTLANTWNDPEKRPAANVGDEPQSKPLPAPKFAH